MQFKTFTAVSLLATTLTVGACSSQPHDAMPSTSMSSGSPAAMTAAPNAMHASARTGTFQGLNDKHVGGTVQVTGEQVELTGFSSDAGPDLHIYLANGTDEAALAAGKEIGAIAYDKASQSSSVSGIGTLQYHVVVINCDKAKAVFGSAALT